MTPKPVQEGLPNIGRENNELGTDGKGRNFVKVRISKGWRLFTIYRLGECPECGALVGDWKGASKHKEFHNFIDEMTKIVIELMGGTITEPRRDAFSRDELSAYYETFMIGKQKIDKVY